MKFDEVHILFEQSGTFKKVCVVIAEKVNKLKCKEIYLWTLNALLKKLS